MYPNLKIQMWRVGIRQNRLAQMLSLDEPSLSRVVNGFRKPTEEMREKIAALLQCDQEWLFHVEETGPPMAPGAPKPTAE